MAINESSESEPLLVSSSSTPRYLSLSHSTTTETSPVDEEIVGHGDPFKAPVEEAGRDEEVDDARAQQFEGLPEVKKQLKYIFPALGIGIFLSAADQTLVASSYGVIGSDLKALNNTSWVATSYFLTLTAFQPLYGKVSDIFGRKAALLFAYTIFGTGCVFCGLARNMPELIAARAFAGIGGGGMTTVVSIVFSDIVPLRERGTWQGVMNIVYASGASAGAPLGGLLADSISWRWAFIGQGPLCLIAFIVVAVTLKLPERKAEHWAARLRRVDFPGALVLVAAISLLLVGLDRGSNESWSSPLVITCLALVIPLFAAFVFVEQKFAVDPFAPSRIIFDRGLLAAYLCNYFSMAGYYFILFYLPLYFQAVEDVPAATAGLRLLPGIAGGVTGSVAGGLLVQRTGRFYWITVAGYVLLTASAAAIFVCLRAGLRANVGVYVSLGLGSLGNGAGITTSLVAIIANAAPEDQAVATACSYLFRSLGSVTGLSILAAIAQQGLRERLRAELRSGKDTEWIVKNVRESLDFVKQLEPKTQRIVRQAYGSAITVSFGLTIGVVVLSAVSAFFLREKRLSK